MERSESEIATNAADSTFKPIELTSRDSSLSPPNDAITRIRVDGFVVKTPLLRASGTELLKRAAQDRLRMWRTGDDDPTLLDEVAA
jgi:hypothetical protein